MRVWKQRLVPISLIAVLTACLCLLPVPEPRDVTAGTTPSPFEYSDFPQNPPPPNSWREVPPDPRDPKLRFDDGFTPGYLMRSSATGQTKVVAGDAYKIAFNNAAAQSFLCPGLEGFDMYEVGVVMFFPDTCTITLHADLEQADMSDPACPKPGAEVCTGASVTYSISPPPGGAWGTIWLPLDCVCADFDDTYLFGVFIDAVSCPGTAIVLSSGPALACKNYYNPGSGWADMTVLDPALPGNLMIFGSAVCCDDPVPGDASSWGALKERFDGQP